MPLSGRKAGGHSPGPAAFLPHLTPCSGPSRASSTFSVFIHSHLGQQDLAVGCFPQRSTPRRSPWRTKHPVLLGREEEAKQTDCIKPYANEPHAT